MKFWTVSTCLTFFLAALTAPVPAPAAVVHFDTPEEYATQFNDNSNGPVFSWSAGAGVRGASGRIEVADEPRIISTALYREPFDLSAGARHEASAYFVTAFTDGAQGIGRVGFAPAADASFSGGHPWLAVALRGGSSGSLDYGDRFGLVASYVADVNTVEDIGEATPAAEAFDLFSGHWYKLATGWTYAGGGRFAYDATLTDYGRTGSAPDAAGAARSIRGSFVNEAFADPARAAMMFAGVRSEPHATRAWDEFEVRVVPEPSVLWLLLAIPLFGFRRRGR